MTTSRIRLLAILLLLSLAAIGCVPTRIGVSWAGLTPIGDQQNILVVYNDFMAMVDPATGEDVRLLNEEGAPRIDPETNRPRVWRLSGQQGSQFFSVPLVLDDNTLLAADYNKRLFRIDMRNARIENPSGLAINGNIVANLTTDGERIYLPSYNNDLTAIDAASFDQLWRVEIENGVWSQPLLHEGKLYVGSMNHRLYAIDPEADGKILWEVDLQGAIAGSPVEYNGNLYIGSFDRKIFKVALETGEILDTLETENWVWSAPVIVDDVLYASDMAGYAYAVTVSDGGMNTLWKSKTNANGIRPTPLVTEKYVITAGRDGRIDWLDRATGAIMFEREVQAEVLSDILLIEPSDTLKIAEPLVVISTTDLGRTLMSFTLNTAEPNWVYSR